MLKTVGDLLQRLMDQEAAFLAQQNVTHAPTIGAMYEGLTADLVKRSLPVDTLTVSSGFIADAAGTKMSPQIDCIVALGEGTAVPYTTSHVFPVDRVIAAFQVKKSLYHAELASSFANLHSVKVLSSREPQFRHVRNAFQGITGRVMPDEVSLITDPALRQVLLQLSIDASLPARIVLGYEGYKTISGLRSGIAGHLESLVGNRAAPAGPSSLPDLILNSRAAVVKANGFPYQAPMVGSQWPVLLSAASEPPVHVLLEVLWTRIQMRIGTNINWFGDDLNFGALARFVDYEYQHPDGWVVSVIDLEESKLLFAEDDSWHPTFISEAELNVLGWLAHAGEIDLNAPPAGSLGTDFGEAVASLEAKRLIGPDVARPSVRTYLTQQCVTAILPDGRMVAADNQSGRLSRWLAKQMSKEK